MSRLALIAALACLTPACFAGRLLLRAQQPPGIATVETWAGSREVRTIPVEPAKNITVLVVADACAPDRVEGVVAGIEAFWTELHETATIRLGILQGGKVLFAGPFGMRAKLQAAARELKRTLAEPRPPIDPTALLNELLTAAPQLGTDWSAVVLVGDLPSLDRSSTEYAAAILLRTFAAQKLSLSWLATPRADLDLWQPLFAGTGGVVLNDLSGLAAALGDPGWSYFEEDWDSAPLKSGFLLAPAVFKGGPPLPPFPDLAVSDAGLPTLAAWSELRRLAAAATLTASQATLAQSDFEPFRASIERALAIDPRDPETLRAGASVYEKVKGYKTAALLVGNLAEVSPSDAKLFEQMGQDLFQAAQFEPAEKALLRARELGSGTAAGAESLARIRLGRKDDAGALPLLAEVLKAQPERSEAWFLQGEAAQRAGQSELMFNSWERSLALDAGNLPHRTALVRAYIESKRREDALRHIHVVMAAPPPDGAARTTYAGFLDGLDAPAEALAAWRIVLALDPKNEAAWLRVGRLSLASGDRQSATAASEAGIDAHPDSAGPYVLKADVLLSEGAVYAARVTLNAGKAKVKDVDLYRRAAECEDAFRGSAARAWRDYAELLADKGGAASDDLLHALRRGLEVAVRDDDAAQVQWFAEKLRGIGQVDFAGRYIESERDADSVLMVPGGIDALAFIARARERVSPERFLAEYCQAVSSHTSIPNQKAAEQYLEDIKSYFQSLAEIETFGVRETDGSVVTLSLRDKGSRQNAAKVLALLGLRLRTSHDEVAVEEITKGARKQDLGGALGVDAGSISKALGQGKDFRVEIPYEAASVWPEEKLWRQAFYQKEKMYGGLAEAVTRWPRLARLYKALSVLDRPTLEALLQASSLKELFDKHIDLLTQYSAAFSVQEGRAVAPGGDRAETLWSHLAGASPRQPAAFFRALLTRDDGRLLAYFFTLSQLDPAHQAFFTLNESRASQFYQLFGESAEGQKTARVARNTSFSDFLRDIPLDEDGHVNFPGSAEVWMVARGSSTSDAKVAKLLKKVSRTVAPDQEDRVLARLAETRYHQESQAVTEMDNFLAVSRIDAHRSTPLDDDAAMLLAQRYGAWSAMYPYFTTLTGVDAAGLRSFFAALDKLSERKDIAANAVAGEFQSLIELLCLLERRGELTEAEAATLFGGVSEKFAAASGPAEVTAAGAAGIVDILSHCRHAATGDQPDLRVRVVLLGDPHPLQVGSGESSVTLDPISMRRHDFDRVMEMQKAPTLEPLLAIADVAAAMSQGAAPSAAQIQALQKAVAAIPSIAPGKEVRLEGREKENLRLYETDELAKTVAEIVQKAARKKPNPKDFQKFAEDLLAEAQPQFSLALSGLVYAWYMRPGDLPVSEDALLLRKHHFENFEASAPVTFNAPSSFQAASEGAGSYFVGGFAAFATAAGQAAAVGLKAGKGVPEAVMAAQIAAVRDTIWAALSEADQRLFNLRIQLGREWIVASSAEPTAFLGLSRQTQGLLSPARRSELLSAVAARSWARVWNAVTLSDVYALGLRCAAICDASLLQSPVAVLLRGASLRNDGHNLDLLGPVATGLYGCSHPHLLPAAPYEQYARHMFPTHIAERSAEFKLQLALAADQAGIPPAALGAVAEPLLREVLRKAEMSGVYDWRSLLESWQSLGASRLEEAFESQ